MHLMNRIAVPWGITCGIAHGVLRHFHPHEISAIELIAFALTPPALPFLIYGMLKIHRDILKTDLDCSPFDPSANPLALDPTRPINSLGAMARGLAGVSVGLATVSFLNWPFNLLYAIEVGLTTISLGLTVAMLPRQLRGKRIQPSPTASHGTRTTVIDVEGTQA